MTSLTPEILLADSAWLRSLTRRLTSNADAAADLEQEVAVAALGAGSQAIGRGWLAAVARNLAGLGRRRSAREAARLRRLTVPEAAQSAAELVASAELQQRAVAAVLALAPQYRDTVLLRFLRGMSLEQTAQHLGVPVETVRTRQKRALAQLRSRLVPRRIRTLVGLGSILSFAGAMKAKLFVAATAAVLLLGLGTAALWSPPSDPAPPPVSAPAVAAAQVDVGEPEPAVAQEPRAERTEVAPDPNEEPPASAPPEPPVDAGSIRVTVVGQDGRTPIAGMGVLCRESQGPATQTKSDANGEARFPELAPGTYHVSLASGFGLPAKVVEGAERQLTLRATPGKPVRGQVLDPAGVPVAGAEIFMMHAGAWPAWPFPLGSSAADGTFELDGVVEHQSIGARHPHFGVSKLGVLRKGADGARYEDVTIRFQSAGTSRLSGRVVDAQRRPVANAWVQVAPVNGRAVDIRPDGSAVMPAPAELVYTDGKGEFVAAWQRAGEHEVYVFHRGFAPSSSRVELTLHAEARVEVELLPGATLKGTVRDENGEPVDEVSVRCKGLKAPQKFFQSTGKSGEFEFADLPAGTLVIESLKTGFSRASTEIEISGTGEFRVDPVLSVGNAISGRLLAADGTPLVKWFVTTARRSGRYARTGDNGRFRLTDCAAEGNVLLFRPDFGQPIQLRVEDVAPSSEERVYYVPADAVPSAHLRGQCLDAAGAPLPDVTIRLFQEHDVVHRGTKTQADGTFDIGPLPSGTYRIVPRHETATFEAFDRTLQAHEEVDLPPIRAR